MSKGKLHHGYVICDNGTILVQVPDPNSQWGFYLTDGDQSWDGGFGIGGLSGLWEPVDPTDPRITPEDRDAMDHLVPIRR